jgi:RimJ/RimL family protein N-acetyltransferase
VAVTVADDWQGNGVGSRLLDALLREACQRGLTKLTASVRLENRRAIRLARRFGTPSGRPVGGWAEFEIPTLNCPPATVSLARAC